MAKPGVLVAAILGSSMAFIDGTALNVAPPLMQRDLQASSSAFVARLAALIAFTVPGVRHTPMAPSRTWSSSSA